MAISDTARSLILEMEGFSAKPDWPGGQFGVTVGFGYGLGCVTVDRFESDWGELVRSDARQHLGGLIARREEEAQLVESAVA